ncbi:MAG TPA: cellulase family glycosylhydrolase, partial [Chitinophagaceae bacterium]|nr:cellulase family glycosylhydrolase [Chitinophagaceae bacterium]
ITKADVDSLHAWGFNSIRLPMHYNLFTLPAEEEPVAGQNTWLKKGFELTDSLLSWCRADHMYLILDLHAAPGGQGNDLNISDRDGSKPSLWQSDADQQKTIALWKKLAEHYKNEKWIGGYDILNEPNWGFTDSAHDRNGIHEKDNAAIRKLFQQITAAIRSVDKNHIIIIEGNGWGNNYAGILPTWDKNMVLSFHKYWNYNKPENIQRIIDTRNKYEVPVWLGETGENSNVWYTEEIELLEKNNIGWSMWPLKKMGANNPLEIPSNLNYDDVKNFMNEKGRKPKESAAYSGLLELAEYARNENNIVHRDVIDALFRQPFSSAAIPFHANQVKDSLHLAAVDYDLGRNGVAYYDMDTANYSLPGGNNVGNRGHVYRNDGVDIYIDSSKYNTCYVGSIEDGEWLQYTINVSKSGSYIFHFLIAPAQNGSEMTLLINNQQKGEINISPVPEAHTWHTFVLNNIHLSAGKNRIKILASRGGFGFEAISIIKK